MNESTIRYSTYPRTEPPAEFAQSIIEVFRKHEMDISTEKLPKGLESDAVLKILEKDLQDLGFEVETGKKKNQKIERPVFYGENGQPTVCYQIDGYSDRWKCGLEIEAGRAWMGNAVYRDLIQAAVMVEVDYLCLAIPNSYKYLSTGKSIISKDYERTANLVEAIYGHARVKLPYKLILIGY